MVNDRIKKQKQIIAQSEKILALEKIKKRRADTRHKIELGGLVIKSGMNYFNKAIILGSLYVSFQNLKKDCDYKNHLESIGNKLFKD